MFFHDHPAYIAILNKIEQKSCGVQSPLTPNRIADDIGYSVIPIREALIRLTSEDVIDCFPNRGFFTKTIQNSDIIVCHNLLYFFGKMLVRNAFANDLVREKLIRLLREFCNRIHTQNDQLTNIVKSFYMESSDILYSKHLRYICFISLRCIYISKLSHQEQYHQTELYRAFFARLLQACERQDLHDAYGAIDRLLMQTIANHSSDGDVDHSIICWRFIDQH